MLRRLTMHAPTMKAGLWRTACAAAAIVTLLSGPAEAQLGTRPVQGPNRPTTSPYLNLLNSGGNSGGLNFFTQVRPQQQFRANEQNLRQEVAGLQQAVDQGIAYDQFGEALLPQSGHPTAFMNQNGYFGTGPATTFSSSRQSGGLQGRPSGTSFRGGGAPRTGAAVFNSYSSQMNRRPAVPGRAAY
jgi:hypothetical protein